MPEKARRTLLAQAARCTHCARRVTRGDYAFVTSRGLYCSTTCKMWHEGQHTKHQPSNRELR